MYGKNNLRKKGVSTVLATVLIVLLTISAASIIAGFVIPFVKENLESGSACVKYRDYFKFQEIFEYDKGNGIENYRFNCYDSQRKLYGFSLSTKSNETEIFEKIAGFDIVLIKESDRKIINVREEIGGTTSGVRMIDRSTIKIPVNGIETYVYNLDSEIVFDRIEIHPVLKSGETCEESDSITIIPCASNINGFEIPT